MNLNLLFFENRLVDRELDRFNTVDKLSWHPNQVDKSPYSAMWNNPFRYNDPDGNYPQCPVGFAIGFIADIAGQVIQNKLSGKSAFENLSYTSAVISGVAGMASGGVTSISKTVAIGVTESIAKQVISDEGIKTDISLTQTVSDVALGYIGGKVKIFDDANIKVKENSLDRAERILAKTPDRAGRIEKVVDAKSALKNANNTNTAAGALTGNGAQAASNVARKFFAVKNLNVGSYKIKDVQMVQDNLPKPIPHIDKKIGG